ncbi:MAG: HU family DNA-binding protein [Bacteroidia bacterium]|nr:HU family DNA-binding protein [Bacteroidia bacterium]
MENKKISIQELTDIIAKESNSTKKFSEDFIRELVDVIEEYLEKDGIVKVKGLGTFKLLWIEDRKSVNVTTGETIILPARYKVSFIPESSVKQSVNAQYSHLETFVPEPPQNLDNKDSKKSEEEQIINPIEKPVNNSIVEKPQELAKSEKPITEAIEAKQDVKKSELSSEPEKKQKRNLTWLIILTVLLLLCGATFYFQASWVPIARTNIENWLGIKIKPDTVAIVPVELEDSTELYFDSLYNQSDTLVTDTVPIIEVASTTEYTPSVAQNAPIRETVIVRDGSRLTMVAYRAYGHKAFWVYVYDANRDVLRHPNDVAQGMRLSIPDLDASLVDPNNEECIKKAIEIGKRY